MATLLPLLLSLGCNAFSDAKLPGDDAPSTTGGDTTPASTSSACALSVTQNTYSGRDYWGTIAFENQGPASAVGLKISFDVPSGVQCDYEPYGWNRTSDRGTCVFESRRGRLDAGDEKRFDYSVSESDMTEAKNLTVTSTSCATR